MAKISKAVGPKKANIKADVLYVQKQLNHHKSWLWPLVPPKATGIFNDATHKAIVAFQTSAAAYKSGDGVIDVNGYTLKALEKKIIPKPTHRVFTPLSWVHSNKLTDSDFTAAATTLGCEVAAIRAVAIVEAGIRGAWDERGRPIILYERHKFSKHTSSKYNRTHSDISNARRGEYGRFSQQYPKLLRAATLDETAALKSASWGKFQILGENYKSCGYSSVAAFVTAMAKSEANHLKAFVSFIKANANLHKAIKAKKWAAFAKGYNGPKYADNKYDTKMKTAYDGFIAAEKVALAAMVKAEKK